MKRIIAISSLVLLSVAGIAQQRTQSSFNYLNTYNFNKSYAGKEHCTEAFFQHKNQWVGIEDAPANSFIQAHTRLPLNFGIGLGVNNWSAGLLNQFDASLAIANHISIKDKVVVSPSVNVGYARFSLNADEAIAFDSDTYLDQNRTSTNSFYADLGLLVSYDALEVGVSIPRVITSDPEFDVADIDPTMSVENYVNAHAAYNFEIKEDWDIKPMLVYRSIPENGQMLDIMAAATYGKKVGVALGYRTNSGLLASANYTIKDMFTIGYGYDVGGQQVAGLGSGSHEVLVGFKLCKEPKEKEEKVAKEKKVKKEAVRYYLIGKVADQANEYPLTQAQIMLKDTATGVEIETKSDSAGNYKSEVLPSTYYEVVVNHPDYQEYRGEFTSDATLTENAKKVMMAHKTITVKGTVADLESKASLRFCLNS